MDKLAVGFFGPNFVEYEGPGSSPSSAKNFSHVFIDKVVKHLIKIAYDL